MPVYVYVLLLAAIVVALLAGFGVAYMLLRNRQGNGATALEAKAQQALSEAETQAKEKLLEAKEDAVKVRTAAEQEAGSTGFSHSKSKSAFSKRRRTSIAKARTSTGGSVSSPTGRRGSTRSRPSSRTPIASRNRSFSASPT